MTINPYWVRNIPARWRSGSRPGASSLRRAIALGCLFTSILAAAGAPAPNATRTATGLTSLASGIKNLERREPQHAEQPLKLALEFLPQLKDYASFYLGTAQFQKGDFRAASHTLESVWNSTLSSPLASRAILLAAQAKIQSEDGSGALKLLRKHAGVLDRPQADLVLAMASEAAGDPRSAAESYQVVFYQFPASQEAAQAEAALGRLKASLGNSFPAVDPATMIGRAQKLMESGNPARAKRELTALAAGFGGADQELARVRLAAVDYFAKDDLAAYRALKSLSLSVPEIDAERYYYLINAARRLDRADEMVALLREMGDKHPDATWRREALVQVANYFLVKNQPADYLPLYRAYMEAFPQGPQAAYCHWKVAWSDYLARKAGTADRMRYHVRNFPNDEKAAAALYYLGRLSERAKEPGAAKVYFQAASTNYPNFYYGVLSRKRLAESNIAQSAATPGVEQFIDGIAFSRPDFGGFQPTPATRARIERSRQLFTAGLKDLATAEIRFGAKNGAQGHLLAMELAERSVREGNPSQGLRWIKALAPAYLYMPLDAAPDAFWRLAFPLPFKNELARNSRAQQLDPYVVAALVRQESEFNPTVISHANAYGLTQVLPSTGRSISRKAGVPKFKTSMLFVPEINLKLGTYYFRMLLDELRGQWESALASYNAGKSRVVVWRTWSDFREPAEFVETIPFTETRNYVQVVMRNADVYRRLYGDDAHAALRDAPEIPVVIQKASYSTPRVVKAKSKAKVTVKGKSASKVKAGKKSKPASASRKKRSSGALRKS